MIGKIIRWNSPCNAEAVILNRRTAFLVIVVICLVVSVSFVFLVYNNQPDNGGSNTAPRISLSSPHDGRVASNTVTISVSVTDEENLIADVYIDGSYLTTANTYDWDTTVYTEGLHTIRAQVTDSGGLTDSDSIDVLVDNVESTAKPFSGTFKVMTYNIEESGLNPDWKHVIWEENPDILILEETGTFDDNGNSTLTAIINQFNAYFVNESPYVGYCAQWIRYSTSGEAILSRFPIISFNQIPVVPLDDSSDYDVTHDFIEAVVDINGTNVHVFGAHLKAMDGSNNEWKRERETEGIINYMDNLGDVPIMYFGDQNSFSPDDTGDLAPHGDLGYGPMTMMLYPDDPTYGIYSSTVHNFTDVFRTLNPTDPGYSFGHQSPSHLSRIDYIIINSFFIDKLLNSTCGDTLSANTGSDHYSVDMFIQWNTTSIPVPASSMPATFTGAAPDRSGPANLRLDEDTGPYLWRPVKNILKIHVSWARYGTKDLQGSEWMFPLHRFRESCP
jgi:endonuclease/exonuclease/phosphatase family metal-dependent hydrolase